MLTAASCLSQAVKTVPLPAVSVDTRKNCAVPCHRHAGLSEQLPVLQPQLFLGASRRCATRRTMSVQRATPQDASGAGTSGDFNLSEYVEAKVERGKETRVQLFLATSRSQQSCCAVQLREHRKMLAQSCSKCWTEEAISCRFSLVRHNRSQLRSVKLPHC